MDIFISRDGQQYGPYSPTDCRSHFASGQLLQDDLAWHEGLNEWKSLSLVLSDIEGNVEIYILRDGQQTGPFQRDSLKANVSSGQIAGDSWAWHDGLSEWKSLSAVLSDLEGSVEIYVLQDGQQTGPFQRDVLKTRIESGQIAGDSWAWHEGLSEWVTIEILFPGIVKPVQKTLAQTAEKQAVSPKDQKNTMKIILSPSMTSSRKITVKR